MSVSTCMICFAENVKIFNVVDTHLKCMYEKLINYEIQNDTHHLCFICHTRLQQCHQLFELALKFSSNPLEDGNEVQHKSTIELSKINVVNFSLPCKMAIKKEPNIEQEKDIIQKLDIKVESDIKQENVENKMENNGKKMEESGCGRSTEETPEPSGLMTSKRGRGGGPSDLVAIVSPGHVDKPFKLTTTPGGSLRLGEEGNEFVKTGSGRKRALRASSSSRPRNEGPPPAKRKLNVPDRDIEAVLTAPDSGSEEEVEEVIIDEDATTGLDEGLFFEFQPQEAQFGLLKIMRERERERFNCLDDILDVPESTSQPAPPLPVEVQVEIVDERSGEDVDRVCVTDDSMNLNPEIVHGQVFTWQSDFSLFQGQAEIYLRQPGPTIRTTCPYELFSAVWDENIMQRIVRQTNLYAWQTIGPRSEYEAGISARSRINDWKDVDVSEMYRFFAVLIYMSLDYRPRLDEYWMTGILEMPAFRRLMSRDRFLMILKFLHFVDNEEMSPAMSSYEKKVYKIAPIVEHCNSKFRQLYVPQKCISLDESLLLWKGRLSWAQCIPTKAARFGIKTFELCEGETGYMLRTLIYTGKNSSGFEETVHGFQNSTAKIVLKLMEGFLDVGHTLVMDNWYNQLSLTRYLKARKTDVIGTLNRQRPNVPEDIRSIDERRMPRWQIVSRHCTDISVVSWKDVKLVTMISTYHTDETYHGQRASQAITKPVVVRDYNSYMGGVDLKDQRLSMYLMERKRATKWFLKFFRRLLNTSLMNSFILMTCNARNNGDQRILTHRQFRSAVAESLVRKHTPQALPEPIAQQQAFVAPVDRLDCGMHTPVHTRLQANVGKDGSRRLQKRRCARCSAIGKVRLVTNMCSRCNVGLCIGKCFEDYHSLQNLKRT